MVLGDHNEKEHIFQINLKTKTHLSSRQKLANNTVDLVKGYTKASVICFVLLTCSELDLENDWDKILPFTRFLDRAWLLPMHLLVDQNPAARSFENLTLSYRGSERQAPSLLSLALQLSSVMTFKSESGLHPKEWNTEQRLRSVVDELHCREGFLAKWMLDGDKFRGIHNLLCGTTAESRSVIQAHLNYHKYQFSAFNSELLRNARWLTGAYPSKAGQNLKGILTIKEPTQVWFLKNHVHTFLNAVRKVKVSSRPRMRATIAEWEKAVDYTCVMYEVYQQAKEVHASDEALQTKVLNQLWDGFMARHGVQQNWSTCSIFPLHTTSQKLGKNLLRKPCSGIISKK